MTRTLLTLFIDVSILVLTRLSILVRTRLSVPGASDLIPGASDLSGKSAVQ